MIYQTLSCEFNGTDVPQSINLQTEKIRNQRTKTTAAGATGRAWDLLATQIQLDKKSVTSQSESPELDVTWQTHAQVRLFRPISHSRHMPGSMNTMFLLSIF